jgi:threonine dehydratase
MTRPPSRADVEDAELVIRSHIRETPIIAVDPADFGLSCPPMTLKLEFLQHSGTFKARGAFTNLLLREGAAEGVVAASGGNHGAAVAFAAQKLGYPARIFVPATATPAKIDRIRSYGAEVVVGGERYKDAFAASQDHVRDHGGLFVHAYDQPETLMGQGTTALEWRRQSPDLDTVLIAVGGGGLIGGMAAWFAGGVKVVGVEPELCPTLHDALDAGKPVDVPVGGIAADSLGGPRIGELCFAIAQKHIDRAVLVTDAAIADAQRLLWQRLRVAVEPGGAAAFAALLTGAFRPDAGERVGVLLCGANTGAVNFA